MSAWSMAELINALALQNSPHLAAKPTGFGSKIQVTATMKRCLICQAYKASQFAN
jgi:hypothetical protein